MVVEGDETPKDRLKPLLSDVSNATDDEEVESAGSIMRTLVYDGLKDARACCPFTLWLPDMISKASSQGFLQDFIAGITVAAVLVPQGMAYGMLALLPPVYGLYTSMVPALAYMLFGSCLHLSVGPFALISMLVGDGIRALVPYPSEDPDSAIEVAILLSLMSGILLIGFGFLRLGFTATFLSDSVLSGFCTAASVLIPVSQLKYAFQVPVHDGSFATVMSQIVEQISQGQGNPYALLIFSLSIATIIVLQNVNKSPPQCIAGCLKKFPLPAELIVVIGSTALTVLFHLGDCPGPCVAQLGPIPKGLPAFSFPAIHKYDLWSLLKPSFVIAVMTYIISMSVSKTFARKYGYEVDSNQEFVALGIANVLGCFSSSYPAAASLSRTAIAGEAGATSPMHNLWTVLAVAAVLQYLVQLVEPLPLAALAAIVVMAFKSLLTTGASECLWSLRVSRSDFMVWQIAFWATLMQDVTTGLAAATLADLAYLVYKTTRPNYAILGRIGERYEAVSANSTDKQVEHIEGVLIFQFQGALHFANREVFAAYVFNEIRAYERKKHHLPGDNGSSPGSPASPNGRRGPSWVSSTLLQFAQLMGHGNARRNQLKFFILDCSMIAFIDMSACRSLDKLRRELLSHQTCLLLANCGPECYRRMKDMKLFERFEDSGRYDVVCFRELSDAVRYAEDPTSFQVIDSVAQPRRRNDVETKSQRLERAGFQIGPLYQGKHLRRARTDDPEAPRGRNRYFTFTAG